MIRVDENDPVGEVALSFPQRNVQIKREIDPKDEYSLEEEIGRGKFGTVFRCKEKATGLPLAAKFIACPKKEDRRNVEREIDIMRTLQHPRLIQVYDAFENGKIMCVILELIEGGELFERVIDDDFVLTEKSCTIFMRQICEGVDFIHKQKILHLDMKPENVLCLTKTGNRIKIIDFGLARTFDPEKKLQVLFGTPEFVAPEVVNFDRIGYGTDMWSVGVICYVLLSGLSPFMGHTDVETMANVTIGKYDFEDEAFLEISANAKDFIGKLLVKDIDKRMSAEECLKHEWLKKKKAISKTPSNMEVTKDNLKQFVERWNEHPNSPYIFESASHLIFPVCAEGHCLSDSLESLVGLSPSPCGSLASLPDSDEFPLAYDNYITRYEMDPLRRASDSFGIVKTDLTERVNLAEEIRKLSDKLFQLSTMNTQITNNQSPFAEPTIQINANSHSDPHFNSNTPVERNIPIQVPNQTFNWLPRDNLISRDIGVPWRKTKYKLSTSSRDVPLQPKKDYASFCSSVTYTTINYNRAETSPSKTKDLLLKLLQHWDMPQVTPRQATRHRSISTEWTEQEALGQRTISSLNTFFQSRTAHKKITHFHQFKN